MISKEHLDSVCQLGTNECCAYLTLGGEGFDCAKNSNIKFTIDLRLAEGTMNATGDNCDGWKETNDG